MKLFRNVFTIMLIFAMTGIPAVLADEPLEPVYYYNEDFEGAVLQTKIDEYLGENPEKDGVSLTTYNYGFWRGAANANAGLDDLLYYRDEEGGTMVRLGFKTDAGSPYLWNSDMNNKDSFRPGFVVLEASFMFNGGNLGDRNLDFFASWFSIKPIIRDGVLRHYLCTTNAAAQPNSFNNASVNFYDRPIIELNKNQWYRVTLALDSGIVGDAEHKAKYYALYVDGVKVAYLDGILLDNIMTGGSQIGQANPGDNIQHRTGNGNAMGSVPERVYLYLDDLKFYSAGDLTAENLTEPYISKSEDISVRFSNMLDKKTTAAIGLYDITADSAVALTDANIALSDADRLLSLKDVALIKGHQYKVTLAGTLKDVSGQVIHESSVGDTETFIVGSAEAFEVLDVSFYEGSWESESDIANITGKSGVVFTNVTVTNSGMAAKDMVLFSLLYEKTGSALQLVDISQVSGAFADNAELNLTAALNIPNTTTNYVVKAALWDGTTTMKPLEEVHERTR